jgi:hypothetical protein
LSGLWEGTRSLIKGSINIIPGGIAHWFLYGVWEMDCWIIETWTASDDGNGLFVREAQERQCVGIMEKGKGLKRRQGGGRREEN